MIRHAYAPGAGDPEDFRLGDCSTQRNLSERGREQARSIGAWLRARGVEHARVYSSQWCRCLETAELLDLGPVTALPASGHGLVLTLEGGGSLRPAGRISFGE